MCLFDGRYTSCILLRGFFRLPINNPLFFHYKTNDTSEMSGHEISSRLVQINYKNPCKNVFDLFACG